MRSSGMHVSFYHFHDLSPDDFEEFCKEIDDDLFVSAPQLASEFYQDLKEINSTDGIKADFSFKFRVLEFGRIRMSRIKELGFERALRDTSERLCTESAAIQAAFELGFAAGQYSANKHSEEYFWAGVQTVEAREAGQERARRALVSKGKKTRAAIARAAEEVRHRRPDIAHNVAALAREILKLDWPELIRSDGSRMKEETVCKYLREARKRNTTENRQDNPESGKTSR